MKADIVEKAEYPQLDPGTYTARIYEFADLGSQKNTFDPSKPDQRRLWIGVEFPNEKYEVKDEEKTHTLGKELSNSLPRGDYNTGLGDLLTAVGIDFTEEYDITSLIGKLVGVVVESTTKDKRKIAKFAPLSRDLDPEDKRFVATREPKLFVLDGESDLFDESLLVKGDTYDESILPPFVIDKIQDSPEYNYLKKK